MKSAGTSWWPVAAPIAFLVGAGVLTRFITDRPEEVAAMTRGIASPTIWPSVMLYGVMLFSLAWTVQQIAHVLRAREGAVSTAKPAPTAGTVRVWLGIVLVLSYGFALPLLGFAFATLLYIVLWLLLGGIRSLLQISLLGVLGTTGLMYLFIKLALMPLDRGVGRIGDLTVALYRLLRIY